MFSRTVMTPRVARCASFRHPAMNDIDSEVVHSPTVDPGLMNVISMMELR